MAVAVSARSHQVSSSLPADSAATASNVSTSQSSNPSRSLHDAASSFADLVLGASSNRAVQEARPDGHSASQAGISGQTLAREVASPKADLSAQLSVADLLTCLSRIEERSEQVKAEIIQEVEGRHEELRQLMWHACQAGDDVAVLLAEVDALAASVSPAEATESGPSGRGGGGNHDPGSGPASVTGSGIGLGSGAALGFVEEVVRATNEVRALNQAANEKAEIRKAVEEIVHLQRKQAEMQVLLGRGRLLEAATLARALKASFVEGDKGDVGRPKEGRDGEGEGDKQGEAEGKGGEEEQGEEPVAVTLLRQQVDASWAKPVAVTAAAASGRQLYAGLCVAHQLPYIHESSQPPANRPQFPPPVNRPQFPPPVNRPQYPPPVNRPHSQPPANRPQFPPPVNRPQFPPPVNRPQYPPPVNRPHSQPPVNRPQFTPPVNWPQFSPPVNRPQFTRPVNRLGNWSCSPGLGTGAAVPGAGLELQSRLGDWSCSPGLGTELQSRLRDWSCSPGCGTGAAVPGAGLELQSQVRDWSCSPRCGTGAAVPGAGLELQSQVRDWSCSPRCGTGAAVPGAGLELQSQVRDWSCSPRCGTGAAVPGAGLELQSQLQHSLEQQLWQMLVIDPSSHSIRIVTLLPLSAPLHPSPPLLTASDAAQSGAAAVADVGDRPF
ncbi:unnamed protein product [Closterium sp. Naga37s-1]|nr:unnamed protein product [Closterium sp. Naga37s-1]